MQKTKEANKGIAYFIYHYLTDEVLVQLYIDLNVCMDKFIKKRKNELKKIDHKIYKNKIWRVIVDMIM